MRFSSLALLGLFATAASAEEAVKKVLAKTHDATKSHAAIMEELTAPQTVQFEKQNVESFTCTLTGAQGQDQCDAATDDDGSKCVWCELNNFGFCVSEEQAEQFEQVMPTIDCDNNSGSDDDKAVTDDKTPDDGPLWKCLDAKDEASCTCVWCNTKGGFGVCLTPEAADLASDSYWFDCPAEEDDEDDDDEEKEEDDDQLVGEGESRDQEEMEDWTDGDEEEEDYDDEEEEDDDMHEFVVDTSCVLSGMLLDPADDEATSENACFLARDATGNPCEWCAVAGSPFRLCLSEPQAQVAEYVGAVCTGSDESFEPEDFDDSCVAHMHNNANLGKDGCWEHQDLDGNGCEWCNVMGVELCLGGVQAELVEHWGATCVLDNDEHAMAEAAIKQHHEYILAQKEAERIEKQAQGIPEKSEEEVDEDEIDLDTLWMTSDPSCMVTTLRTSIGDDDELACAQMQDANGNPCNWCEMGTSFFLCLNDEQADLAEYMGIECETISTETQDILKEHAQRAADYEEEEEDEEALEGFDDVQDFDPSCIMAMQNGPDQVTCVNTKDQDGASCEWCSWNQFQVCLAAEQAEMIEPFGVKCDQVTPRPKNEKIPESAVLKELTDAVDTSCLIDAGAFNDPAKCTSAKDTTGQPCEWCSLGSLGVNACMSAEQAEMAKPLGVTCQADQTMPEDALLKTLPKDFFSCLSQSQDIDECDETCTWCDLKNSPTGAGLCLSDPVADAVIDLWPESALDCSEVELEEGAEGEEEFDDEEGESESDSEDEGDDDAIENDDFEEETS